MEITYLADNSIKVRGKQASFVVNPLALHTKTSAQAALFFERLIEPFTTKFFEQEPLLIQGPGEYEVGGIKISGSKVGESFLYRIIVDGIDLLVAKTSSLGKSKDSVTEYHVLLLDSDNIAEQSVITALNPNVIVFYGEKKMDNSKALGKEETPVSKYAITKDKLPTETQVVTLG